jgi:hypothetical protein
VELRLSLLLQESWPDPEHKVSLPMAMHAIPGRSLPHDLAKSIPGFESRLTLASDYLCQKSGIREATREVWVDDGNFVEQFDWFEFFLGLVNWDLSDREWGKPWAYRGGFTYRDNRSGGFENMQVAQRLDREIAGMGEAWPPLESGFFSGRLERAVEVAKAYIGKLVTSH